MKMTNRAISELIKPIRRNTAQFYNITAPGIGYLQCDLMQMTAESSRNKNYQYGLVLIDIYSRYGACIPIKNKTAVSTMKAFEEWKGGKKIIQITTDNGSEWKGEFGSYLKREGIEHVMVAVGDHTALGIVDRFVQTIRRKILEMWLENGNVNWIDHIDKIIREYNHTVHSTIHAKPIDVWHGKTEPQQEFRTVDELKVGTHVRVKIKKGFFEKKSSTQNWSSEVYKIEKKDGHRYLLEGKPGRWALYDLQVTKYPVSEKEEKVRKEQKKVRKENAVKRVLKKESIIPGNVVVSKRMRKENVRLSGYVKF